MSHADFVTALAGALQFGGPAEKVAIVCTVIRALADDDDLPTHFAAQIARDPAALQAWQLAAAIDRLDQFRFSGTLGR